MASRPLGRGAVSRAPLGPITSARSPRSRSRPPRRPARPALGRQRLRGGFYSARAAASAGTVTPQRPRTFAGVREPSRPPPPRSALPLGPCGPCGVGAVGGPVGPCSVRPRAPVWTRPPARRVSPVPTPGAEGSARLGDPGTRPTPAVSRPWTDGGCSLAAAACAFPFVFAWTCVHVCVCARIHTNARKKSLEISRCGFPAAVRVRDPLVPAEKGPLA